MGRDRNSTVHTEGKRPALYRNDILGQMGSFHPNVHPWLQTWMPRQWWTLSYLPWWPSFNNVPSLASLPTQTAHCNGGRRCDNNPVQRALRWDNRRLHCPFSSLRLVISCDTEVASIRKLPNSSNKAIEVEAIFKPNVTRCALKGMGMGTRGADLTRGIMATVQYQPYQGNVLWLGWICCKNNFRTSVILFPPALCLLHS